jgi:hypothetical protein
MMAATKASFDILVMCFPLLEAKGCMVQAARCDASTDLAASRITSSAVRG